MILSACNILFYEFIRTEGFFGDGCGQFMHWKDAQSMRALSMDAGAVELVSYAECLRAAASG
jgi:hypothetical protein